MQEINLLIPLISDTSAADGKGPNGYVHGGAPVGSVIPLPAQNAQASTQSAQASGPATAQNPQVCLDLLKWLHMCPVVFLTDSEGA